MAKTKGFAPEYPEGTHPPAAPEDQAWGPGRFSYSDAPEDTKPDKSTVAQTGTAEAPATKKGK